MVNRWLYNSPTLPTRETHMEISPNSHYNTETPQSNKGQKNIDTDVCHGTDIQ